MINEDYKDMLQSLLDHEVRFIIVGAYAMGAMGYPRATGREKDKLDVENIKRNKL